MPHVAGVVTQVAMLCLCAVCGCQAKSNSLAKRIHVSMRQSSLVSSQGVLQIANQTDQTLMLGVFLKNLDNNQVKLAHLPPLLPYQSTELGILELGWSFEVNEDIAIFDADVKPDEMRFVKYRTYRSSEGLLGLEPR
jgi:hypothetical protein